MTFLKNLCVLVAMCATLFIGAWLNHMPADLLVLVALWLVAAVVAVLVFEDLFRKLFKKELRMKQTKEYYGGVAIMIGGVIAYIRFIDSKTDKEFLIRLGITFFLMVLGLVWDQVVYAASIRTPAERAGKIAAKEQARWRACAKMAVKAGKEGALPILGSFLKYHIGGDTIDGPLNLNRPIAMYEGVALTHKQLLAKKDDDKGNVKLLRENMWQYLATIIKSIPEKGEKE